VPAQAAVEQAQAYAEDYADNIRDPIVKVGAAIEAGLNKFNGAAKRARADEHRQKPEAARAGDREGECGEGDEVHELVAALGRRGRRLQGPEHRDGQGERHDYGEGDVEVLAHATRLTAPGAEHKRGLSLSVLAVKWKDTQNQGLGGSDKGIFRANFQNAKMFSHKATYMDDILLRQICAKCCAKKLRYEQK